MTVYDLNRDQLIELKEHMLTERYDERGESPSWGDLAEADDIISDEEVFEEYGGTQFSMDDFFCTAGQEEDCFAFTLKDNPIYGSKEDIARILIEIAQDIRNGAVNGRVHAIRWRLERERVNW